MIKRPPPMEFSYGVVEKALATAYGVSEAVRPAGFRGMISNLHKLGALGPQSRVGRGAKLTYTHIEFTRLILAIEFCEFGLPPATAAALVGRYWECKLKTIIGVAHEAFGIVPRKTPRPRHRSLSCRRRLRTDSLRGEKGPVVPVIDRCSLDDLPDAMRRWMTTTPDARGLIMNPAASASRHLSALAVTNLDDALDERRGRSYRAPGGSRRREARRKRGNDQGSSRRAHEAPGLRRSGDGRRRIVRQHGDLGRDGADGRIAARHGASADPIAAVALERHRSLVERRPAVEPPATRLKGRRLRFHLSSRR